MKKLSPNSLKMTKSSRLLMSLVFAFMLMSTQLIYAVANTSWVLNNQERLSLEAVANGDERDQVATSVLAAYLDIIHQPSRPNSEGDDSNRGGGRGKSQFVKNTRPIWEGYLDYMKESDIQHLAITILNLNQDS